MLFQSVANGAYQSQPAQGVTISAGQTPVQKQSHLRDPKIGGILVELVLLHNTTKFTFAGLGLLSMFCTICPLVPAEEHSFPVS